MTDLRYSLAVKVVSSGEPESINNVEILKHSFISCYSKIWKLSWKENSTIVIISFILTLNFFFNTFLRNENGLRHFSSFFLQNKHSVKEMHFYIINALENISV